MSEADGIRPKPWIGRCPKKPGRSSRTSRRRRSRAGRWRSRTKSSSPLCVSVPAAFTGARSRLAVPPVSGTHRAAFRPAVRRDPRVSRRVGWWAVHIQAELGLRFVRFLSDTLPGVGRVILGSTSCHGASEENDDAPAHALAWMAGAWAGFLNWYERGQGPVSVPASCSASSSGVWCKVPGIGTR